jgi:protoheme IX farnesyltransferase
MSAGPFDPVCLAAALGGTYLCSASANSINQLIEVRNDAAMNRTAKRPLPAGRISREHAIGWATFAGVAGVGTLALGTDCVTASLGATTLGLYTLVYTPMKQRTPLNTWVGAVVGAIPPVMGWTAAGGSLLSLEAATLGSALFLWQMPHFFALAWMYRADYAQGGYRMIPLHDPSGERTSALCFEYSLYLAALPPLCWASGLTSCMFAIESTLFNGVLLAAAWRFRSNSSRGQAHARRLFLVSLAYLPIFFGCLLLHQRRQPATLAAATDDDASSVSPLEEPLERIRARGRELCLHEQVVEMQAAADDGASAAAPSGASGRADAATPPAIGGADGEEATGNATGSTRCPVFVAEAVGGHVRSSAQRAQQAAASAQP